MKTTTKEFSKLYTFGDSWTELGYYYEGSPYKELYPNLATPNWAQLLADHYSVELINRGKGGCSFDFIEFAILTYLEEIEQNSLVVVGGTSANRVSLPLLQHPPFQITNYNGYDGNERFSKMSETIDSLKGINFEEVRDALSKYSIDVRAQLSGYFEQYYYSKLLLILEHLKETKNVTFLLWNWETIINMSREGEILTILEETNGVVNDLHPGGKGSRQIFQIFLNQIESNKFVYGFKNSYFKDIVLPGNFLPGSHKPVKFKYI